VFPYEWYDSPEKMACDRLPPADQWYSKLTMSTPSPADLARAQQVWEAFSCRTMQDYLEIYLAVDVAGLADAFEAFRTESLTTYHIDPAHCYTGPGMAWEAMLRLTGATPHLLTEPEHYMFIETGIRGGISQISTRHAVANHPLMGSEHDPDKPPVWLAYLDCNALYSHAMQQPLPYRNFRWVAEDLSVYDILHPPAGKGYTVEVDLEYPAALHVAHDDYPLAPEKGVVAAADISPYSARVLEENNVAFHPSTKLLATLRTKKGYVVHHRAMLCYLEHGLRVAAVHRVMQYEEEPWMAPYIEYNMRMRQEATTKFRQDFYKLMSNAVFGKTMENVRDRKAIKFVRNVADFKKLVAKPEFARVIPYSVYAGAEDTAVMAAIVLRKTTVKLSKPVFTGQAVLDISKATMYDFHYGVMKPKYGQAMRLLFTDTDSLAYKIATPNMYADMLPMAAEHFDTSAYPAWHELYDPANKRVTGKFKDEAVECRPGSPS
jgi:hypothetical protein